MQDVSIIIDDKRILNKITLSINSGQVCALMGPNGSGKSTLAYTIMGHPRYHVQSGLMTFHGVDITALSVDARARLGIFLSFQQPIALPGVTVYTFLYEAYRARQNTVASVKEFDLLLKDTMQLLHIDSSFAQRALNDNFSGGEKKRFELLQLIILQPKLALLDEIDSGLDVDTLAIVARGIEHVRRNNPALSILIITHYARILQHIIPDVVYVMHKGKIISVGDASLAHTIDTHGYANMVSEHACI